MPVAYSLYSRQAIKQEPQRFWVDGWRVDYLAFALPENAHKPPLLVVGGAFQNFTSYKYCVERIYQDFPVVLIDLPSLGNNDQVAPELGMIELADLLYALVEEAGWPQVHLMGLSLGSAIASSFACQYPARSGRLIVAGIVENPRKSWRMLVDESARVLAEGHMDIFSQGVVLYLVNYQRLKETGMTATARKLFYRQMKRLNANERERYVVNGARLSTTQGLLSYPECETLVTTGEYDSFTLPWENAQFAQKCPNARFVLINNADHMPQLEQREVSLELFSRFLNGKSLEHIEGTRLLSDADIDRLDRRRDVRRVPLQPAARLITDEACPEPLNVAVEVVDINFFGCLIRVPEGVLLGAHERDCVLQLQQPKQVLGLLIFEQQGCYARCLFKHGNTQQAETFVAQLKDTALFVLPEDVQPPLQTGFCAG